jgi:glutathione S-transferase
MTKGKDLEKVKPMLETGQKFEDWLKENSTSDFIMGTPHPTLVDIDVFPTLWWQLTWADEKHPLHHIYKEVDMETRFPKTVQWIRAMEKVPEFQETLIK